MIGREVAAASDAWNAAGSPFGATVMRYELSDSEWNAIRVMLPNKPRGVARVDDRRVLNGIFWVLRPDWRAINIHISSLGQIESSI